LEAPERLVIVVPDNVFAGQLSLTHSKDSSSSLVTRACALFWGLSTFGDLTCAMSRLGQQSHINPRCHQQESFRDALSGGFSDGAENAWNFSVRALANTASSPSAAFAPVNSPSPRVMRGQAIYLTFTIAAETLAGISA
jgi:hypothetical protein